MNPFIRIHTRLTPEVHQRLKLHCADRGLNCQDVIATAIEMYIKKYERIISKQQK